MTEEPTQQQSFHYVQLPSSIFRKFPLSILEAAAKYLKDEKNFSFHEIGEILYRDERNIWTVYSRAKKKLENFVEKETENPTISDILIPSTIFHEQELCVLETLSEFLKDQKGLSFKEIAGLLGRDQRNIWTVYSRAKKKRAAAKENEK